MKRLNSYIVKSFLGPFFMTFFIVLFVLLMQFLWGAVDDLVGKGLEFKVLVEIMFYASFGLLPFAFPLAMLLASIMTFGALGENYELVAIKASGISLFRIMRPLMVITLLITGIAFYFSNNVLPHTNTRLSSLLNGLKKQRPEMILQPGVFTSEMDDYSIKIGRKNNKTNMLYDLLIYDHTNGKANESVTIADSGFLKITEDKRYMVLNLFHGENYVEMEKENRREENKFGYRRNRFEEQTIRQEVSGFDFKRHDENVFKNWYRMLNIKQLKMMEDTLQNDYLGRLKAYLMQINVNRTIGAKMPQLTTKHHLPKEARKRVDENSVFNFEDYFTGLDEWQKTEITTYALENARRIAQKVNVHERQLYERKLLLNKYKMERHKKFTLPFAVIIFFFIGAPLGAIIRKGGLGMPVVVSILLFILYYIVSISGEKMAREDMWDMHNGMWFSSYIFLLVGIWLTYKAATDASVMSSETYLKLIKRLRFRRYFRNEQK